jgi:hypothetical protein
VGPTGEIEMTYSIRRPGKNHPFVKQLGYQELLDTLGAMPSGKYLVGDGSGEVVATVRNGKVSGLTT